jgi:hypothetical protein
MRRLIAIALVGLVAWRGYETYVIRSKVRGDPTTAAHAAPSVDSLFTASQNPPAFKCDGRVYCSQMTSCAEAEYFLSSCPGVKMDGDNDGVPCEKQWCK